MLKESLLKQIPMLAKGNGNMSGLFLMVFLLIGALNGNGETPLINLDRFEIAYEDFSGWEIYTDPRNNTESILMACPSTEFVKDGTHSLKIDYKIANTVMDGKAVNDAVTMILDSKFTNVGADWSKYKRFSFWIYNVKENPKLGLWVRLPSGLSAGNTFWTVLCYMPLNFTGWKKFEYDLTGEFETVPWHTPRQSKLNLANMKSFSLSIMDATDYGSNSAEAGEGTIYLSGLNLSDTAPAVAEEDGE